MEIHKNIKKYREKSGLSQEQLAVMVGYKDRSSIAKIEAGQVDLSQSKIASIAKALNVSPTVLMGWEDEGIDYSHPDILSIKTKKIPLIGGVACGEPIYEEEDFECYVDANEDVKADFAMRCHGDSMINIGIKDGYIVFIKQQSMVDNGEVAAVNIDGTFTLKRFFQYGNMIVLRSENSSPEYKDLQYPEGSFDNFQILGKAIAFQGNIR